MEEEETTPPLFAEASSDEETHGFFDTNTNENNNTNDDQDQDQDHDVGNELFDESPVHTHPHSDLFGPDIYDEHDEEVDDDGADDEPVFYHNTIDGGMSDEDDEEEQNQHQSHHNHNRNHRNSNTRGSTSAEAEVAIEAGAEEEEEEPEEELAYPRQTHGRHTNHTDHEMSSSSSSSSQTQYPLSGLRIHEESVVGISTSPHQPLIASVGDDYRLVLYKINSEHRLQCIRRIKKKYLPVSVSFDNTGDCLAIAMIDGVIEIWDVTTMKPIYTLKGHTGSVLKCEWSPAHRNTLATIANDKTFRIWHPHSLPSTRAAYVKQLSTALTDIRWQHTMKNSIKLAVTDSQNTLRIYNTQNYLTEDTLINNNNNNNNSNGEEQKVNTVQKKEKKSSRFSFGTKKSKKKKLKNGGGGGAQSRFDQCFVARSMGDKIAFGEESLICVNGYNLNLLECQQFERLNTIKTNLKYHNTNGIISHISLQNAHKSIKGGGNMFATGDCSASNIVCLWEFSDDCNFATCCGKIQHTHNRGDRKLYSLKVAKQQNQNQSQSQSQSQQRAKATAMAATTTVNEDNNNNNGTRSGFEEVDMSDRSQSSMEPNQNSGDNSGGGGGVHNSKDADTDEAFSSNESGDEYEDEDEYDDGDRNFITNIEFCKHVPQYLLSTGKDGTVKLWDCNQLTSHYNNHKHIK